MRKTQVIVSLATLILLAACGDQKGFKARVTTPADVLRAKAENAKKNGTDSDKGELPAAGEAGSEGVTDGAISIPAVAVSEDETAANLTGEDDRVTGGFAQIVGELVKQEGAPAAAVVGAATAGADATQVTKLKAINDAKSAAVGQIIKGMDVRFGTEGTEQIKVDTTLMVRIADKDLLISAEGLLKKENQLSKGKIVPLTVTKVMDMLTQTQKVNGVELFAALASEDGKSLEIMALFTRVDKSQVSFVGRFGVDGKVIGSNLGTNLKSVQDAQMALVSEASASAAATVGAEAPAVAASAPAVAEAAAATEVKEEAMAVALVDSRATAIDQERQDLVRRGAKARGLSDEEIEQKAVQIVDDRKKTAEAREAAVEQRFQDLMRYRTISGTPEQIRARAEKEVDEELKKKASAPTFSEDVARRKKELEAAQAKQFGNQSK